MSDTRKYPYVSDLEKKRDSLILKMYRGEMTKGNYSINTINRVLKMGGLKLGIAPPPKVAKYWAGAIEKSFSE